MTNTWRDYRGFKITTNKTFEDTRDRITRGVTEAVVVGYYFYAWRSNGKGEPFRRVRDLAVVDYPTESEAVAKAQETIDDILNREAKDIYLAKNTRIGVLEYVDIFSYHGSQPRLFFCRSQYRQLFFVVWVDETETSDKWLSTAISSTRYEQLKNGIIDTRAAFMYNKEVSGFFVETSKDGVSSSKILFCSTLTDNLLPAAGEFLKYN